MGFDGDGDTIAIECQICANVGLQESDGFYYCQECGAQAEGLMDTGVADEDFVDGALFNRAPTCALYNRAPTCEKYSEAEGDNESQCNSVCNEKRSRNDDGCLQNQLGKKRTEKDGFESIFADSSTWQIEEESYESPSPGIEFREAWLEERINYCVHLTPSSITCEFCSGAPDAAAAADDLVGLSQLDLNCQRMYHLML